MLTIAATWSSAEEQPARNMFQACKVELNTHCKGLPAMRMQCLISKMDSIESEVCKSWINGFKTCMGDSKLQSCLGQKDKKIPMRVCVMQAGDDVGEDCKATQWYDSVKRFKDRLSRTERIAGKRMAKKKQFGGKRFE